MADITNKKQEDMNGLTFVFNKIIWPEIEKLKASANKDERTFKTIVDGSPDIKEHIVVSNMIKWEYQIGFRGNNILLRVNQIGFREFYFGCFSMENKEHKFETTISFKDLENFSSILKTAMTHVQALQNKD